MRRGFILIDVTIAYVILTVALVALLPVFAMAIKAGRKAEQLQVATQLSQELMEEVRMRKWDQNVGATVGWISNPSTLGIDAGETASNKVTFNDIDDFDGWSESGVRNPLNVAVAGFGGYSRNVTVSYVNDSLVVLSTPTLSAYKKVTVCTSTTGLASICLNTVVTNR